MKARMEAFSVVREATDFWNIEAEVSTIRATYVMSIEANVFEINVTMFRPIIEQDKWFIEAWLLNMLRTHFDYKGSAALYYSEMGVRITLG